MNGGGLEIVESSYNEEDAIGCASVQVESYRKAFVPEFFTEETLGEDWARDRVDMWKQWTQRTDKCRCFIAKVVGLIVGYSWCGPSREAVYQDGGEVYSFYIHPNHWGTGVSRPLMDVSLNYLRAQYDKVCIVTFEHNRRSIPFYKKCGFVHEGFVENRTYLGFKHNVVVMVLRTKG